MVNIGEAVQYIPREFLAGTSIKSVVIPDAVTEIGSGAFDNCQYLEHITIGKSVLVSSSGGTSLCSNCTNLKSLTWNVINPDPYNSPYQFYIGSRGNIEQITFGDCVERIPSGIAGGSKIQSITIPASVKTIDVGAFAGCSQLENIEVDCGNDTFDSRNNCNGVVETSTNTLISGCKGTIIPNTVTSIANYAFYQCTELTNIDIPNSVVAIGSAEFSKPWRYGPFYGCTGLKSVTMSNSVTFIGPYAFQNCTELTDVKYSENLREIGKSAFQGCSALNSIDLPSSLRLIDVSAFEESGLEDITIPDSVVVKAEAFSYSQIINVTVSNSARLMGEFIFAGTPWLKNQPDNGLIYADNVLYRYYGYIPEGMVISIPDGTAGIAGGAFGHRDFYPEHIISAEVPNSVKYIGDEAFTDCSMLKSVTTGKGLEIIGKCAFQDCYELEKVTLERGIKSIGAQAFSYCPKLVSITCLATTPPTIKHKVIDDYGYEYEYECFDEDTYSNAVLFVPKGSEVAYMMADTWKKFIHIVGIDVNTDNGDVNGDGEVNIADINVLCNEILSGSYNEKHGVNGDGEVNIADINAIVNIILGSN